LRGRQHNTKLIQPEPHPLQPKQDAPWGIRSPWHHPPLNIALEEGLRTHLMSDGGRGFFLCGRNGPSVIVGRNQNALAELSPRAQKRGLRVYRRTSGGGAVYHDEGNLNWCWVVPGGLRDRERLLGIVLGVLQQLGIAAVEGPRAGIFVGNKKIGGTACAAGNEVLLFHGTLLVSTDLEELQLALAAHTPTYPAPGRALHILAGVASVPSDLSTLKQLQPQLDIATLETALFAAIAQDGAPRPPDTFLDMEAVHRLARTYDRKSWILDRTPPDRKLNPRKARHPVAARTLRGTP
jgi:lipoate---protein ligase